MLVNLIRLIHNLHNNIYIQLLVGDKYILSNVTPVK